jgi:polyisoprenoid-binding protein YceI
MTKFSTLGFAASLAASTTLFAAPANYTVDPEHTYPSFEAPHIAGISIWRGKFDKTTGKITLDRAAKKGTVDITVDASSFSSGHEKLDEHMKGDQFFNVAKFPTITFKSTNVKFNGDAPSEIDGTLTMHGVSKPVKLKVNLFKCIPHPMLKKEVCGADASAELNRSEFGLGMGVEMTGDWVRLAIQVEALKDS